MLHALLVIEQDNQILLMRDAKNPIRLKLPGGKAEGAENFQDALIREITEELGIALKPEQLVPLCKFRFSWLGVAYHHMIYTLAPNTINWQACVINCEPEECSELVWVDKYNLPNAMLEPIREELEKIFFRS